MKLVPVHCPSAFSAVYTVWYYSVQHPGETLSRDIQVDFYRQGLTIKITHHIESSDASAIDECIVHKID